MRNLLSLLSCLLVMLQASSAQTPVMPLTLTDAEEIRIGQILADQFAQEEGMAPTPQTRKLDEYLQTVGDRVASTRPAQASLQVSLRSQPGLQRARSACPADRSSSAPESWLTSTPKISSRPSSDMKSSTLRSINAATV